MRPPGPHVGAGVRPPPLTGPLALRPIVCTLSLPYRIDDNVDRIDVNARCMVVRKNCMLVMSISMMSRMNDMMILSL
jgi:hypothetical protein